MNKTTYLLVLLLSLSLLMFETAVSEQCSKTTVGSGPELAAVDLRQDFFLRHPLFEKNFDVKYPPREAIPKSVDIQKAQLVLKGGHYHFRISTAGKGIRKLMADGKRSVQFGVFVDSDFNGLSDLLLITTTNPKRGAIFKRDLERAKTNLLLTADDISVTMSVPESALGKRFGWVAFTGYSPHANAYFRTRWDDVRILPVIDLANVLTYVNTLVFVDISGRGQQCQVTDMGLSSCPPPGNPPGKQAIPTPSGPHPTTKGWMFTRKQCGARKVELWCYGAFGRWVEDGANKGWIARCPFLGGQNFYTDWDYDGDGAPDVVHHWVHNGPYYDDDHDKCRDEMDFLYRFRTNLVTITNREYDSADNVVVEHPDVQSPHAPFDVPGLVPGPQHQGPPTHPPGQCP